VQGIETVLYWIPASYVLLVNVLSFCMMWWDKKRAENNEWRVAEATLLLIGLMGGAVGLLAGTFRFRHKTRKRSFRAASLLALLSSLIIYWLIVNAFYI
jgi:uncharacterized membrane protein YsdA (DUF1294 family)